MSPVECGREDINSGAKDAHELYARDRLRRNVQWMAGVAALEPPTLSEMAKLNDALFDKVGGARRFFRPFSFFNLQLGQVGDATFAR